MQLIWRPRARAELRLVLAYIAARNTGAAEQLRSQIEETAERLVDHPLMFRAGRVAYTREAIAHPNYILVYRVSVHAISIVSVLHATQQYP